LGQAEPEPGWELGVSGNGVSCRLCHGVQTGCNCRPTAWQLSARRHRKPPRSQRQHHVCRRTSWYRRPTASSIMSRFNCHSLFKRPCPRQQGATVVARYNGRAKVWQRWVVRGGRYALATPNETMVSLSPIVQVNGGSTAPTTSVGAYCLLLAWPPSSGHAYRWELHQAVVQKCANMLLGGV